MPTDANEDFEIAPGHQFPSHVPERRHRFGRVIIWSLLLLIVTIAVFVVAVRRREASQKMATPTRLPAGISVSTATAQKGNIGLYLDAIGTVTPVYTDSITSQVNGQVLAVHYQEGQRVKKGDPLIDIDARPYQATLLQAQGSLERDQNLLAQAQMDLQRYTDAWNRNAIARQILDDQEKLVAQDEGLVKNDQGAVNFDQVQVEFCGITAPIDGQVGLRLVDPGNVVQSSGNVTLAVITQLEPITVIFVLSEDDVSQVLARVRQGAKLAVEAYDRADQNQLGSGTLLTLDNQIDTTTGTVKARALFDNKNGALFPNEFVNTRLLVNTLRGVTLVPSSAIQQNGQVSFVYVIQNNVAHIRNVKAGVTDRGMTQVEGINPGDAVANSSFDKLQDNAPVTISNNPAPASEGGSSAQ